MELENIIKLLDAGYTKDEINALMNQAAPAEEPAVPAEEPAPEPAQAADPEPAPAPQPARQLRARKMQVSTVKRFIKIPP